MNKGKLYLIPTIIGDGTQENTLPKTILKAIKKINIFIVENLRTARRQIKSIEMQHNDTVRMAKISFGGIVKEASLEMLPDANIGDYVLVHVGVAISKVNEEEAQKTFKYLEEIGELGELEDVEDYLPKKE